MNRSFLNFLVLLISVFLLVSCGKKQNLKFEYSDKTLDISCDQIDSTLIKEALFSFEDDITKKYTTEFYDTRNAYRKYIYYGMSGKAPYGEMVSPHTLEVMQQLKNVKGLWLPGNDKSVLNYDHPFVSCLLENISNSGLKTTISSLKSVNALSPAILERRVRNVINEVGRDKYLAIYIALDSYYGRLYDLPEKTE